MDSIIILFVTFLALSSSSLAADETETAFHYKMGEQADPSKWSMTKKEWKICGTGKRQSPIDLSPEIARLVHNSTKLIQTYYKPVDATLKNRGYDIMVHKSEEGHLAVIGVLFREGAPDAFISRIMGKINSIANIQDGEATIGSCIQKISDGILENSMNIVDLSLHLLARKMSSGPSSTRLAMELHMVHKSEEGHLAVIGVLFREGAPDAFISRIMGKINSIANIQDGEATIGELHPKDFGWDLRKFYEYSGSLTTPPCTEDVIWTIINKVGTVSREQIKVLVDARRGGYEENARPAQPLNNRVVYLNEQSTRSTPSSQNQIHIK
ncbi:hypothetical protein Bca52824_069590 [Brassica carinata]|uniref:Alpha-carbonic anhydrase domain-containing protein n=1 Tax=Brassica carinata TaxID=52824 RepID=A0A8X7Q2K1_BRACI|nr:hypothetical protein Bca52824_069590 [Brassica carinata]